MKFLLESAGSGVCVSLSPDSISLASQCRCPKNRLLYIFLIYYPALGASLVAQMVKESACNAGDPGLIPGLGRSLGEEMATHSSTLAGEFHGWRSLAGYRPWGRKESDTTERLTLYPALDVLRDLRELIFLTERRPWQ